VKEARIRSSSPRRLQTSEFMSKKFILTPGSLLINTSMTDVVLESTAPIVTAHTKSNRGEPRAKQGASDK
jgi:hypothetical protein